MNPKEVAALSDRAIETSLTDLVEYLLQYYSVNTHFDPDSSILHAYVLKPGANTYLRLHMYFYYDDNGAVWYCVDTTGNSGGCILEYGCTISDIPRPNVSDETDYVDAQVAKDSIRVVIDSFFDVE